MESTSAQGDQNTESDTQGQTVTDQGPGDITLGDYSWNQDSWQSAFDTDLYNITGYDIPSLNNEFFGEYQPIADTYNSINSQITEINNSLEKWRYSATGAPEDVINQANADFDRLKGEWEYWRTTTSVK